ncbi:MAG: nucleotidyltransferase domain-containing protein [Egibacteraceae bacterium]
MIPTETLQQVVRVLVDQAQPRMVILFGSYARGEATDESDLDLLVVLRQVTSRRAEMVRLRNALRPLRIPADVLVVSEAQLDEWGGVHGTVVHQALSEGRVLFEAA